MYNHFLAHAGESHMDDAMSGGGMFGAGWYWFIMVVLWALLIGLIIVGLMKLFGSQHKPDPLSAAKNRYAKGEISKNQYQEIKKELSKK